MSISLRIAELQRVAGQLEDDLTDLAEYPERDRAEAADALDVLASRLELARVELLLANEGEAGA